MPGALPFDRKERKQDTMTDIQRCFDGGRDGEQTPDGEGVFEAVCNIGSGRRGCVKFEKDPESLIAVALKKRHAVGRPIAVVLTYNSGLEILVFAGFS